MKPHFLVQPLTLTTHHYEEMRERKVAEIRRVLDKLWSLPQCAGIAHTLPARFTFLALLADRIGFMKQLRRSFQMMRAQLRERTPLYDAFHQRDHVSARRRGAGALASN
jgi:hypothetical protein